MTGSRQYESGGIPLLIPQDYRGELLRDRRRGSEPAPPYEESPTEIPAEMTEPADSIPADGADCTVGAESIPADTAPSASEMTAPQDGGTLLGGLYRLLIGESGAEEETLLLLAVALLLLWGHLDRGGSLDRSSWDGDDLALLLIGCLLLS